MLGVWQVFRTGFYVILKESKRLKDLSIPIAQRNGRGAVRSANRSQWQIPALGKNQILLAAGATIKMTHPAVATNLAPHHLRVLSR
jgi:hypothetical protein